MFIEIVIFLRILAVDVEPPIANQCSLVENCTIWTKETVFDSIPSTHVVDLTIGLSVSIIAYVTKSLKIA